MSLKTEISKSLDQGHPDLFGSAKTRALVMTNHRPADTRLDPRSVQIATDRLRQHEYNWLNAYNHDIRAVTTYLRGYPELVNLSLEDGNKLEQNGFDMAGFKARVILSAIHVHPDGHVSFTTDKFNALESEVTDITEPATRVQRIRNFAQANLLTDTSFPLNSEDPSVLYGACIDRLVAGLLPHVQSNEFLTEFINTHHEIKTPTEISRYFETLFGLIKKDMESFLAASDKTLSNAKPQPVDSLSSVIKIARDVFLRSRRRIDYMMILFHQNLQDIDKEKSPFNLRRMLDALIDGEHAIPKDRLKVNIDPEVDDTIIFVHPVFDGALLNLLSNAGKYAKSRVIITVKTTQSGNTAVIIADDGRGIAHSEHEKIFRKGYQVEGSFSGTGTGLAIVKYVVDVHEGIVGVESDPDAGAAFYIIIPSQQSSRPAEDDKLEIRNLAKTIRTSIFPKNVPDLA